MPIDPPEEIRLSLEESLELAAALEDARDALSTTDHLVEVMMVEEQLDRLTRKLGFSGNGGGHDDD